MKLPQTVTACSLLSLLCMSCSPPPQQSIELNINEIKAASRPGVYNIAGSTNLPDDSRIAVTALRYLNPAPERSLISQPKTYSILARQIVPVSAGKWQTTVNFWHVATDGRFQEAWQTEAALQNSLQPATSVTFIATYEPSAQLPTEQQQTPELRGRLVRFSAEGEEYVQASQTLPIAVASGKTTPPKTLPEEINGGWGNRSEVNLDASTTTAIRPKPIKTNQTNAPLSMAELLR
ncbi:hypothetical protein [Gloeocapsopsis dulcis]|uniref:Uncharacterized protein n=1 Tax=Gloeocapsopsis dulcis AAB1 = 1H9 TaxID=1433147 RepID=A0A6N8FRP5_9CHRO|nr:hypothetical protein [Gloeocapsopsis dulcis]MUL35773.1 hypothetical protein [Gloeocapsopsis dulcis AAB1 = 1H9]WNN90942.1 hypothetical protein P0S91_07670 [Gloeocapsopsis dulcis]